MIAVLGFAMWLIMDSAAVSFLLAAWNAGWAGECGEPSSSRVEGGA